MKKPSSEMAAMARPGWAELPLWTGASDVPAGERTSLPDPELTFVD
jgi:hypothetical protein